MKARDMEYVVFDVETTGLSARGGDRIIEIAAVKVRQGQIIDTFESFVNPERLIPLEAQAVNKISDEMVADAPLSKDVIPEMISFISGSCLVAHNIKFDLDFLCYELSLANRKLKDETPALDTLKMARLFLPHLVSYKLENLAQSLGVRVSETHRALADVELTVQILNRLINIGETQGYEGLAHFLKSFGVSKPAFQLQGSSQELLF